MMSQVSHALWVCLMYPNLRHCIVLKLSVSFRNQLQCLCKAPVGQSHLRTSWHVTTTSKIGQFYLDASKTLQQRLRQLRLIDVTAATL